MKILGIGVDIVENKRFKKAIEPCPNKPPTTCDRRNQKSTGGW